MNRNTLMWLGPVFVLFYCFGYMLWGSHIPYPNDLGFDGHFYTPFARNFFHHMNLVGIVDIRQTRFIPALMVYGIDSAIYYLFGIHCSVTTGFAIFNTIILTLSSVLWLIICRLKNWSLATFWIGFSSLFLNFAFLKMYQFNSVITDPLAYLFGMLFLYSYISKRPWIICIIAIFAAFTWPAAIYYAVPLLFCTGAKTKEPQVIINNKYDIALAKVLRALFYVCVIAFGTKVVMGDPVEYRAQLMIIMGIGTLIVGESLYWFINKTALASNTIASFNLKSIFKNSYLYLFALVCIVYIFSQNWLLENYSNNVVYLVQHYLSALFILSTYQPAAFLVYNVTYWGPAIIFALFFLKQISNDALAEGFGMYLSMLIFFLVMLDSESRHTVVNYPILIYLIAHQIEKMKLNRYFVMLYALLCLTISKVYILFHFTTQQIFPTNAATAMIQYPWQSFFLNLGPNFSGWEGYFINLFFTVFSVFFLSYLLKKFSTNDFNYRGFILNPE